MEQKRDGDLTVGSPIKKALSLMIPILLGSLFLDLYGVVDAMIASHFLGSDAVAAIGASSAAVTFLRDVYFGLNIGFTIVAGRFYGAGDISKVRSVTGIMFTVNAVVAVVMTVVLSLNVQSLLSVLGTPEDIFDSAKTYATVIFLGISFSVFSSMFSNLTISFGDSRKPMIIMCGSTVLNGVLTVVFVAVFNLGLLGAALATVISQLAGGVVLLIFLIKGYKEYLSYSAPLSVYKSDLFKETISTGVTMSLVHSIVTIGTVFIQGSVNALGTSVIAGYTVARKVVLLLITPISAIADANAVFVSQNYGAKKFHRIFSCFKGSIAFGLIWSLVCCIFGFLFAPQIFKFITGVSDPMVIEPAIQNLKISLPFFVFLTLLFVFRGTIQGTGHKVIPLVSSGIELVVKILGAVVLAPILGFVGVSLAEPSAWLFCAIYLGVFLIIFYKKLLAENDKL